MAKRLNEDEIKWILSVESGQAQQEIYKLTRANRELNRTNQERRNVMRSLEAQGKKDTEYYRNLEKEIRSTNDVIKKNSTLVGELEKKLDVTGLTMAQLRSKAKELRTQLDNTAQAANPDEYAKLEAELTKVNNRMRDLKDTGAYAKNEITGFEKTMSMAKTAAKGFIAVQLVSYLKNIGTNAFNTRKEFARYEATLKNVTGSGKEASQIMRTLQNLAADTPASVAEWTEAYIKLVNRGIKPTTSELTALGDIATSQGKSLDQFVEAFLDALTGENERLKEFGITAQKNGETTAFTFKGITTEVENNDQAIKNYIISLGQLQGVQGSMATQMNELAGLESNLGDQMDSIYNKIGKKLEPAIKSFMGKLGSLLGSLSSSLDTNAEKFDIQMDKVVSLETDLVPLLDRYDELKTKTNLSAQEQEEMNTLIGRISQIIPAAITGFNSYGQAISVSTDYAREWIKTEKARLAYLNRSQIEQAQKDKKIIEDKLKEAERLEKISKQLYGVDQYGQAKYSIKDTGRLGVGEDFLKQRYPKLSNEEQAEYKKQQQELLTQLEGINAQLDNLQGTTLEDMIKNNTEMINKRKEFNEMNKEQLDAWIADEKNANSQYMNLAKELRQSRFPKTTTNGNDEESRLKEQEKKVQEALARQTEIYNQQQIELKKIYLAGNDEKLQTESQFNRAMEELTLQDLNDRLAIVGLEKGERQKLEEEILDIRIKALKNFYIRKDEIDAEQKKNREKKNKEALEENDKWMKSEMERKSKKEEELKKLIEDSLKEQVDMYKDYGTQIGTALGQVLSGQEDMLSAFGNTILDILFNVLEQIINQKITEATATAVASQAKAAAESAAMPDSVATFGATAGARTAIISGLIMAALATAKSTLKGLLTKNSKQTVTTSSDGTTYYTRVPGKESGGYINVTRSQDGKQFNAEYSPSRRGFIDRPTVIVGEGPAGMSREWVASNAAVMNPTVSPILNVIDKAQQAGTIRSLNLNRYIQARMLGRESGGSVGTTASSVPAVVPDYGLTKTVGELNFILRSIKEKGIPAYTLLSDLNRAQELQNKSRKIGSK